jgi:hypothetical protein
VYYPLSRKLSLSVCASLVLSACGGGGSGSPTMGSAPDGGVSAQLFENRSGVVATESAEVTPTASMPAVPSNPDADLKPLPVSPSVSVTPEPVIVVPVSPTPVAAAPKITSQPLANVATELGKTAIFAVTSTASPAPIYQWQRNGINIVGATSSSYTTPTLVASDNGATFQVVVSNSQGSVTSNAAAVTFAVNGSFEAAFNEKVKLLQFVHLNAKVYGFGFGALRLVGNFATVSDTLCASGSITKSSFNGAAIPQGTLQPAGVLFADFANCEYDSSREFRSNNPPLSYYTGSSEVSYQTGRTLPEYSTVSGTANEQLRIVEKINGVISEDVTVKGSRDFSLVYMAGLPEVIRDSKITFSPGTVLVDHQRGITATINAGTTNVHKMSFGDATFNSYDMHFTVAGVQYTAQGSYEYQQSEGKNWSYTDLINSGEIVLSRNGMRIGRIFVDPKKKAPFIEIDGTIVAL